MEQPSVPCFQFSSIFPGLLVVYYKDRRHRLQQRVFYSADTDNRVANEACPNERAFFSHQQCTKENKGSTHTEVGKLCSTYCSTSCISMQYNIYSARCGPATAFNLQTHAHISQDSDGTSELVRFRTSSCRALNTCLLYPVKSGRIDRLSASQKGGKKQMGYMRIFIQRQHERSHE